MTRDLRDVLEEQNGITENLVRAAFPGASRCR
jgi:hypothetical protein